MRRRTKWLIVPGVFLGAIAVASGFVDVWHEVPSHEPDDISLVGTPRDKAEHDRIYATTSDLYPLRLKHGNGELLLLGMHHTNDPDTPEVTAIVRQFEEFKPDAAFVEGRLGLFAGNIPMGVRQFGEPGAVYGMCRNLSVPCFTFEPTREQEAAYLLERFDMRLVAFAFFYRTYLSDRRGGPVSDSEAAHLLAKKQRQYGLDGTLQNLTAADQAWKDLGQSGDWRTAEESVTWPNNRGSKLQQWAAAANDVRDVHLVKSLITEMRKGKRVFAVAGMSHVIRYERVIEETLKQWPGQEHSRDPRSKPSRARRS